MAFFEETYQVCSGNENHFIVWKQKLRAYGTGKALEGRRHTVSQIRNLS